MVKNIIWDIYNMFRGMIDLSTFSDLMAYSLLLKFVEVKAPHYYQENYSLRYLSRLYGDIIREEDLCRYIGEVEKDNNIPAGLISEPFRNMIHKFDSEKERQVLLGLLRALEGIEFNDETEVAGAFDNYMEMVTVSTGKPAIECYTNSSVAKLEAEVLDVKEGFEVYDPFCGTGITAVTAGCKGNPIYVRDMNSGIISIAAINLILHGCNIKEVSCGDSLFAEDRKYDRIVSEPPFNVRYPNDVYEKMLKDYSGNVSRDALEIEKIINSLNENGKAVILVPQGFFFRSGRTQEYRKYLVESNLIDSIITLPAGVLFGIGIGTALLVVNKCKANNDILMVDSSSLWEKKNLRESFLTDEHIAKLSRIVSQKEIVEGISVIVKEKGIQENDYNLTPTIYVTPYTADTIEVKDVSALVALQKEYEEEFAAVSEKLYELRNHK